MKRILACLAAALLIMMTGAQASTDEVSKAWRAAAIFVPGSALPEGMEDRGEVLAFNFIDEAEEHSFEVLISRESASFLKRTQIAYNRKAAPEVALNAQDIANQVKASYPDAGIDGVFTRQEEGLYSYLVVFSQEQVSRLHRSFYNAQDGELLVDVMWPVGPAEGYLTIEQVKETSLSQVLEEGMLMDINLERIGAAVLYLMNVFIRGEEITYSIDAKTGRVLGGVSGDKEQGQTSASAATDRPGQAASSDAKPPPAAPRPTTVPPAVTQAPAPVITPAPARTPAPTPYDDDDDEWDDDEPDDDAWDDDLWDDDFWDDDELDDLWDD